MKDGKIIIVIDDLKLYEEPISLYDMELEKSYRTKHRKAQRYKRLGLIEIDHTQPSSRGGMEKIFYRITEFGKLILKKWDSH